MPNNVAVPVIKIQQHPRKSRRPSLLVTSKNVDAHLFIAVYSPAF
jgi:hypothetical protein